MRGNWSPLNISTRRLVPSRVRKTTSPGRPSVTAPMSWARAPRGGGRGGARRGAGAPGGGGGADGEEFVLVGEIERVQAEELAGALDFFAHRDGGLLDADADAGLCGDFVQGSGQAAAGRVAQAANRAADGEHRRHQGVQRGGIALDGAVELQAFAPRQDGDAVLAEGATQEDAVAPPPPRGVRSGRPSPRRKAALKQSARAPPRARSFPVPWTASEPMSPPGK